MSHTIGQTKQDTQQSNSNSNELPQDTSTSEGSSTKPTSGLSDADHEFLFNQLLEGIAHGWHDRRIIKFFHQLEDRGQQADWVAWLGRLRNKLLKLPIQSKRQLGTMMIRLGELTQSAPEVNQIGAASHSIGKELLFGDTPTTIWEYAGPDLSLETKSIETEQELSERLPDDFEDLGAEEAGNSTVESTESTQDNTFDDELNSNLWLDNDLESETTTESFGADHPGTSLDSEMSEEPNISPAEQILPEDNLDLEVNIEPEAGTAEPSGDLDLALDLETSDPVTSYGEEFEFELDHQAEEESPEPISPGAAADLSPELPISAPNKLFDALQAFDLKPESESDHESSTDNLELSDIETSESSSLIAEQPSPEQQREIVSPNAVEHQELTQELDDSSLELIESWFNLGLKQVSAGEYNKAIASWDKALTINANLSEAWHNRGSALGRLGNYEAAVQSFQNALEIDPVNYQAWNDRAHALYQLEDWSSAIESWNQAIKIMPGNHLFWYNRGCALEQLAKWHDAIASYEKALEIKPDFQLGRSRYINLVADSSRPN